MAMFVISLFLLLLGSTPAQGPAESPNLAQEAQASASESYQTLSPEKANDGSASGSATSPTARASARSKPIRNLCRARCLSRSLPT